MQLPQQQVQVQPFVIQLNGVVQVQRQVDGHRVLVVVNPSGVIAAQVTLDPIEAAKVAAALSHSPNGAAAA
ncbi:MAG TPA: hypothetical protein VGQ45_03925 [Gaiellales bacterium]|jgi:hypothetical protein|nr:hypothetical protein [Gaiellales bacterium]